MLHFLLSYAGLAENCRDFPRFLPVDLIVHCADCLKVADRAGVPNYEGKAVLFNELFKTRTNSVAHLTCLLASVCSFDFFKSEVTCAA